MFNLNSKRMTKKFLFGVFAAAGMLLATSCSNDELIEQGSGDTATVSFTVNTEGATMTRANGERESYISDGTKANELYFFVYRIEGNDLYHAVDASVYGSYKDSQNDYGHVSNFDGKSGTTLTLNLAKGQNYTVAFFAKSENANLYTISDEDGTACVKIDYNNAKNNMEAYDAFFATEKFTVSGKQTQYITLKRPFAQVNVGASDYDAFHASAKAHVSASAVMIDNAASKLSLIDGSTSEPVSVNFSNFKGDLFGSEGGTSFMPTKTLTVNNNSYTWLSMCYVLPYTTPDATASTTVSAEFTLDLSNGGGKAITLKDGSLANMPIQRNYRTNIIGNILTNDVDFNVVIDSNFNGNIWDGQASTSFDTDNDGNYLINSAEDFALLMEQTQTPNSPYAGKTFVLNTDISFGGKTIKGVGSNQSNISFTFDGKNHTISDFVINNSREWYAGLFNQVSHGGCIKNLTVKNATVTGQRMVGVISSNLENGCTIENCHVENSIVVANTKKAGAVVSYALEATVKDCSAKNVKVYCADSDVKESGEVVGFENTGCTIENNTSDNVEVVRGHKTTLASTMSELKNALPVRVGGSYAEGGIIVLTKDIDMTSWTALNGTYTNFILDGNGHTLKNLDTPLYQYLGIGTYEVRNLNFDDANIYNNETTMSGIAGVLVAEVQANGGINLTIDNCNINKPVVHGYKYAGAFIGYTSEGSGSNTATITIKNSSISKCNIVTDDSSCGGFIGHTRSQNVTIKNCNIVGANVIECKENRNGGAAKAGYFIGTVNAGQVELVGLYPSDYNITLKNNNSAAPLFDRCIGRVIDGASVSVN